MLVAARSLGGSAMSALIGSDDGIVERPGDDSTIRMEFASLIDLASEIALSERRARRAFGTQEG